MNGGLYSFLDFFGLFWIFGRETRLISYSIKSDTITFYNPPSKRFHCRLRAPFPLRVFSMAFQPENKSRASRSGRSSFGFSTRACR